MWLFEAERGGLGEEQQRLRKLSCEEGEEAKIFTIKY